MTVEKSQKNKLQQNADRVPHYGLRKLSVGVVSVLLSTMLYMGGASIVQADAVNSSGSTSDATQAETEKGKPTSSATQTTSGQVDNAIGESDQNNKNEAATETANQHCKNNGAVGDVNQSPKTGAQKPADQSNKNKVEQTSKLKIGGGTHFTSCAELRRIKA